MVSPNTFLSGLQASFRAVEGRFPLAQARVPEYREHPGSVKAL